MIPHELKYCTHLQLTPCQYIRHNQKENSSIETTAWNFFNISKKYSSKVYQIGSAPANIFFPLIPWNGFEARQILYEIVYNVCRHMKEPILNLRKKSLSAYMSAGEAEVKLTYC